jgi:hypothetical protein
VKILAGRLRQVISVSLLHAIIDDYFSFHCEALYFI